MDAEALIRRLQAVIAHHGEDLHYYSLRDTVAELVKTSAGRTLLYRTFGPEAHGEVHRAILGRLGRWALERDARSKTSLLDYVTSLAPTLPDVAINWVFEVFRRGELDELTGPQRDELVSKMAVLAARGLDDERQFVQSTAKELMDLTLWEARKWTSRLPAEAAARFKREIASILAHPSGDEWDADELERLAVALRALDEGSL